MSNVGTANVGTVGKNWLRNRNGGQKWVKYLTPWIHDFLKDNKFFKVSLG